LSVKAIQSEYLDTSETIYLDEIASRGNKLVEASFIKEVHDKLVSNGYTSVISTNLSELKKHNVSFSLFYKVIIKSEN
jgi:hypothetical protein